MIVSTVFYSYSNTLVKEKLCSAESVAEASLEEYGDFFLSQITEDNMRITLIDSDGNVLADSVANASTAENHSDREEFKQAVENGEAYITRYSDTENENVYYYAKLLSDSTVLRVSTEEVGVIEFFGDALIYVALAIVFVVALSAIVSVAVTRSIVKPVEELTDNLDNLDDIKTYDELQPLVDSLKEQKIRQKALNHQKSSLLQMSRTSLKLRLHQ